MATTTTNLGLTKPSYSDTADISVINENMDKLDTAVNASEAGLAIMSNNNDHAAISKGQYVYVRKHGTLAEGLYKATANIATNGTLSSSNVATVWDGLGGEIAALSDQIATRAIAFCPTGTATTNSVGQIYINTGITLSGKRVMALSNYAVIASTQYGVYTEAWTSNGVVTCRVRKLSDGTAIVNTDLSLDNIMLIIL